VSHETLCISILLYVTSNHLDVLNSSDVISKLTLFIFCCKDINSDEIVIMHVSLCDILSCQSG
jgi:hypothetical protein